MATFRTDGSYKDGRRPESVEYSNPPEDAMRRDFTVNGLFLDPATGEVIDHVGGRADLERRLLRAIGDPAARFREDHLRLLRCVRLPVGIVHGRVSPCRECCLYCCSSSVLCRTAIVTLLSK